MIERLKADGARVPITVCIMLATLMNSLDTTIANVALPRMAGELSASQDQMTWVLTSYIVSAAIMTPVTGWMADRFGRKMLFLVSIFGFTVASMLCGAATSLPARNGTARSPARWRTSVGTPTPGSRSRTSYSYVS